MIMLPNAGVPWLSLSAFAKASANGRATADAGSFGNVGAESGIRTRVRS